MNESKTADNRPRSAPVTAVGQAWPLIRSILRPEEWRSLRGVAALVGLDAILSLLGVASVLPFLALVANPDLLDQAPAVREALRSLGLVSNRQVLIAIGVGVCVILVLKSTVAIASQLRSQRWGTLLSAELGTRLLSKYLQQPYAWFLNRHTADLSKRIHMDVSTAVHRVCLPLIRLGSQLLVTLLIVALIVAIDPMVALVLTTTTGLIYLVLYLATRRWLRESGVASVRLQGGGFRIASEALTAIKELKVLGREMEYVERYREPILAQAELRHRAQRLSLIPAHLLRTGGFIAVIGVVLGLLAGDREPAQLAPLLGLYVIGGLRILPALQGIFQNVTQIQNGLPALENVWAELQQAAAGPASPHAAAHSEAESEAGPALSLRSELRLDRVTFTYPGASRPTLHDLDLSIPARATVGFVGRTGAGKTTTIDLLLGLLAPSTGQVQVDGTPIDDRNVRRWQRTIGYVPQQVMLTDASVAANVALGLPDAEIDRDRVEAACRSAAIHEFVRDRLAQQYDTLVGERGIRLSGGQRQRIGIARALYHAPSVLVFDEATSAVDNETEQAILEAVEALRGQCTVILIAHRLTTVRSCDTIFLLDEGRLVDQGDWAHLMAHSPEFARLAAAV
jgi:ABC-type multidrug transport system fused ATPase/permease subunit